MFWADLSAVIRVKIKEKGRGDLHGARGHTARCRARRGARLVSWGARLVIPGHATWIRVKEKVRYASPGARYAMPWAWLRAIG